MSDVITVTSGEFVKIEDTISGFKGIVNGDYDHIPEAAFYMVGNIDHVLKKAEELMQKAA